MTAPPAPPARPASPRPDLPRIVGFWGATGVMIGVTIGSGIFATPSEIARQLDSPSLILLAWVLGGVLSFFGALTYSELATMYPRSGGIYVFLKEAYGPKMAFTFGWTYLLITKPAAAAGITVVCSQNLLVLFPGLADLMPAISGLTQEQVALRIITSAVLILVTLVNVWGVRESTGLSLFLTILKVAALLGIVVLGVLAILGLLRIPEYSPHWPTSPGVTPAALLAAAAPVMFAVMWTYDGWSDVGTIAGELRSPGRTLPQAYLINTLILTGLYVAVNAVYLFMIPLDQMQAMPSVAPHLMGMLIGGAGAISAAVIIVVSTLGATHAAVLTGARVTFGQARDGLLFAFLARINPRFQTPATALLCQLVLSLVFTWGLGTFKSLADTFVFTMWIFYGLAAAGIIILRFTQPNTPRPFWCPFYPLVPALFVLAAIGMTVLSILASLEDPNDRGKTTLPWIGVLLLGWPAYYIWRALAKPTVASSTLQRPS